MHDHQKWPGIGLAAIYVSRKIVEFTKTLHNVKAIHLLPYHALGSNKYALLGRKYEMETLENMRKEEVADLEKIVLDAGFECKVGG